MPPRLLLLLLAAAAVAAALPPPVAAGRHGGPPPPPPLHPDKAGGGGVLTTALVAAAVLLVVLVLYLCVAIAFRRYRRHEAPAAGPTNAAARAAAFLRRHGLHQHRPSYTYEQLRAATAGFDPSRKLGDGGFGTVFLAYLPPGGRPAAVKRLHVPPSPSPSFPSASATITKSFCNEVLILSALRHPHLVRLHGFCADPRALLLVYDFVPNGTLSHHLHRRCGVTAAAPPPPPLPWRTRLAMAVQIASALEYLHFGVKPAVVHRDVTSSNIFVEADMRARLGDFGLSRLLAAPDACATAGGGRELVCCTAPQGTPGYLDPDYHRSFQLTEKSDVYSFGVVVLELVTGLRPVDVGRERRDVTLADWVVSKIQVGELREVVDQPVLAEGAGVMASVEAVAELAFRCVAPDKDDRPDAREALAELKRIQGMLPELSGLKGS
ncbi:LEAF RUST 10 DISEASE-RESISTANCE LOCUS RECEPTOR-LIKE PROTEIN KINASE-like 1.5 [Oryza brachyantha]|uniref:LEAF RUST 10 DISEASE-RESISTANCE LOCUS RECEPTOR-LIKE PROTEIN KINASE-like 1.5 n=1 Tax=Oryza brachyantha TaxID=4533 RepID=UPI001AD9CED5|nr:LEAF RUST 10 DISEASE-RESISTANCE LOCUS RECEPTOR-LIKE PROTEIN KINASE-like 1.5 [Oryza brachyantha]